MSTFRGLEDGRRPGLPPAKIWAILLATGCLAAGAATAPEEIDNDTLRRTSVFVEAEDFQPIGDQWKVGEGWADDIYSPTSGNAVLGNDGGSGEARKAVTIPADGTYHVWVRYLSIGQYPGAFGLRIEQGGQKVFDQEYRTHPESQGWTPEWEQFPAELKAGGADLTLYIARPGVRQRVDCILLTPHPQYRPDYLDFAPQVFLRFKVLEPPLPVTADLTTYHHRGPVYYCSGGRITRQGTQAGDPVPPGEWSPWVEISKLLDSGIRVSTVKLAFKAAGQEPLPAVKADIQVSSRAEEAAAKTLHEDLDGDIVGLIIPGDVRKFAREIELVSDQARRHLTTARGLGLKRSRVPKRMKMEVHICGFGDSYRSERILKDEMTTAALLGVNSFDGLAGVRRRVAQQVGVRMTFLQEWIPYQAFQCPSAPDLAERMDQHYQNIADRLRKEDPETLRLAYRNKLWDEPGTADLQHLSQCEPCTRAFHTFLQSQGLKPADFGQADWAEVKVTQREEAQDLASRKRHLWSIRFRDRLITNLFKLGTEATRKHLGAGLLTNVNLTNAPLSGWAAGMVDGPDWFDLGRERAQTLMWSEDWASWGPEVTGYTVDVLRSAGRKHRLPVGMYIVGHHPPTIAQRACSALMHGAKIINFYCYGPYYAFTDGMISESPESQQAIAAFIRQVALADDLLYAGRLRQPETAIIYSKSHEIWQRDSAIATERRMTWLALTQAHIPVDFLSEADLEEGALAPYKAIYLVDSNLTRAAAEKLRAWVEQGGVLIGCAGAGMKDEYDEEMDTLKEVFGVRDWSTDKPAIGYRERYDIPLTQPRAAVRLGQGSPPDLLPAAPPGRTVPVIGYRDALTPATARGLATFEDGTPAILLHRFGRGQALRFGFLPGLAYTQGASVKAGEVVTDYPDLERELIAWGVRLATVMPPVTLSDPRVEALVLESPQGVVVPLANWSMKPVPRLKVTVRGVPRAKAVESAARGRLKFQRQGNTVTVALPLGATDFLMIR
jgi:hypothetical protein